MKDQCCVVQNISRKYTDNTISTPDGHKGEPIFGSNDPDSPLNPCSENFNARAWASNAAKIANEQGLTFRRVGLCFQKLNVFGYGTPTDFQKDVGNIWLALPNMVRRLFSSTAGHHRISILQDFEGLIHPGEMCVVLGPPGSGCTTFLKTISGETSGIHISKGSYFNYQGLSPKEMHAAHRGDAIYTAEVDVHFPQLTVGETLTFASRACCQRELPQGIARNKYVTHISCFFPYLSGH